jgi:hypothetical protein
MPNSILPAHKSDVEAAARFAALPRVQIEPHVHAVLEWLRDMNWPVARMLAPVAVSLGPSVVRPLREILQSDDEEWKYSIMSAVVAPSSEIADALRSELERIASSPSDAERDEGLDSLAQEMLTARDAGDRR